MRDDIYNLFNRFDSTTYNHSVRVMRIAREVEKFYALGDNKLSTAALLHDIGKIYISSKILDKVGRLSPLEKDLVALHPYIGYMILKEHGVDEDISRIVLYHHGLEPPVLKELEPYDNRQIFDRALLLHSIDSFEALTSDRPYHRGYHAGEAIDIMLSEKNHHQAFLDYLCALSDKELIDSESAVFRGNHLSDQGTVDNILFGFSPCIVPAAV